MDLQSLLAKVAHDLKAPARQLNSIVQLLSGDGKFDDDQMPLVEMLASTAQKGIEQVEALSYFAKCIDVGSDKVVMNFADVFESVAQQHDSLSIEGIEQLQFDLEFNPHALKNILTEILSNTIKFSPDGEAPFLSVSVLERAPDSQAVIFSSKSIGVEFDHPKKLLAAYARDAKAKNIDGYGMGLTVVDFLISQSGGSLSLAQVDDCFVLEWQLKQQRQRAAA